MVGVNVDRKGYSGERGRRQATAYHAVAVAQRGRRGEEGVDGWTPTTVDGQGLF